MNRQHAFFVLATLVAVFVSVASCPAQDAQVKWRVDYNAARKEAQEKSMPLMLDFGASWCVPCKRFLETTCRDPKIVAMLNGQFIPVKIDAEKDTGLTQALQITSFPTIVVATASGRILETVMGFKEAEEFHEILQRNLASTTNPAWMVRDYNQAVQWIAKGEYAPAIGALRQILAQDKGRPIQSDAQKLLDQMEKKVREQLARVRQFKEEGRKAEAVRLLTEVMREYPGLAATREAGTMITQMAQDPVVRDEQRARRARELLQQAREFHRKQDLTPCIDRCLVLIRKYSDLAEGQEASQLYAEIKSNPEWVQKACDTFGDRLAEMWLVLAESQLKHGQPQQARHWLERVIRAFPGTHHAESAQIRLDQLQGAITRRVADFQGQP
jgi:thioredoxin-like negative regulator of GroEL